MLYLRFLDSDYLNVSWLPVDNTGPTQAPKQGTPEEAALDAGGRRIILLAPAADTLLTEVALPTQNRQRLLQAVPYALENQIADDIELQHFTVGRQEQESKVSVAIVSKAKIECWLNKLEAAGIRPHAIYPELLCLPYQTSTWTLLADDENSLLRIAKFGGIALDTDNAQHVLELMLEQADQVQPSRINILFCSKQVASHFNDTRLANLAEDMSINPLEDDPLLLLAKNCTPAENLNLLHGPYLQDDHSQLIWRSWLPTLIIGLLFITLTFSTSLIEQQQLSSQHDELSQQIEQLFKKSLPQSKKMVNPRAQMRQKLKELRGGGAGSDFIELLGKASKLMNGQFPTTISGISYRQGQLDLQFDIKDLQMLDKLKQQMEREQLHVEIRSANAQKGSVKAHFQIKGASA